MTARMMLCLGAAALLAVGCSHADEGGDPPERSRVMPENGHRQEPDEPAPARQPPPGAILIGDDVYAVPIGEPDEDGCQRYRLWSPTRLVVQAIHYRRADGSFTMRKDEAACRRSGGGR